LFLRSFAVALAAALGQIGQPNGSLHGLNWEIFEPAVALQGQHRHQPPPVQDPHQHHPMHPHEVQGALGRYPMTQDGSGTAWLPASAPHYMRTLPAWGPYELRLMGLATANYHDAGGPRGEAELFSNSMIMLIGERQTGGGTLQLRTMISLDPVINGRMGYPVLFQTGETAYGEPLRDRQHPHDFFSELAVSYSRPISRDAHGFVYLVLTCISSL
jgi:hypothetical protein